MKNKFFEELAEKIQPYFEEGGGGHGFDHTKRVYNLAIKISKGEEADLDVVKAAALLHDIARLSEEKKEISCHAEEGSARAARILEEMGFPKDKIPKVSYAIKTHRFSKGIIPETTEAAIIQDADRLEALGAIAVARVFSYGGKNDRPFHLPDILPKENYAGLEATSAINHFYEKILKIKPESFKTKKARKMAEARYKFVEKFVDRFIKEWGGKI